MRNIVVASAAVLSRSTLGRSVPPVGEVEWKQGCEARFRGDLERASPLPSAPPRLGLDAYSRSRSKRPAAIPGAGAGSGASAFSMASCLP